MRVQTVFPGTKQSRCGTENTDVSYLLLSGARYETLGPAAFMDAAHRAYWVCRNSIHSRHGPT